MVYPVLTNDEMTTESQRYNSFIRNGGNAIPKHAGPEAKGCNPTTGLSLLWTRNPFRGNFNHWHASRKEAGQIFFKHSRMYRERQDLPKINETLLKFVYPVPDDALYDFLLVVASHTCT